jgi:hypothetical protein
MLPLELSRHRWVAFDVTLGIGVATAVMKRGGQHRHGQHEARGEYVSQLAQSIRSCELRNHGESLLSGYSGNNINWLPEVVVFSGVSMR